MAIRTGGARRSKQYRIPGKRNTAKGMPSADELRDAASAAAEVAAAQKKRGFAKRGKGGRFVKRKKGRRG